MRIFRLTTMVVVSFWLMACFVNFPAIAQPSPDILFQSSPVSVFEQGVLETQAGDFTAAQASFTAAIRYHDHPASAYANRCLVEIQLGEYQRAIQDCTEALQHQPANGEALLNRGLAQYRLGNFEMALWDNTHLLMAQPLDGRAYNNRGLAFAGLNDHQAAIADYEQAILKTPPADSLNLAEIQLNRGISLTMLDAPSPAFVAFNQAIQLNPLDDRAYFNRGGLYNRQQQYQAAIQDFDQALSLRPDIPQAHLDRAIAYYNLGQTSKALTDLQTAAQGFGQQGKHSLHDQVQSLAEQIKHSAAFELQVG